MKRILKNILNALLDRRCYIRIKYTHDYTEEECKKVLFMFSIYVETFKEMRMLRSIPIEHAQEIDDLLLVGQKLQKKVELCVGSESCYETLTVPKWALISLSEEIRRNILD